MIGKTISHYKILEKLGEGGMGVVYKAEDIKLGRPVALKFLPSNLTKDPDAKKRFIQEAKAASALDHSNICVIYEVDELDTGEMFIAMGYYDGETLKTKIEQGPVSIEESVDIALQIARGLDKAHAKGIIHRDIKPANIVLTRDGRILILDFGVAKLLGQTKLTKTGASIGTAAYMSPEQIRGEEVGPGADQWALGVVCYEMLTAQLPFQGEYEQALTYSILNDDLNDVTHLRPDCPEKLTAAVKKTLEKDGKDRYKGVSRLIEDLRQIQKELALMEDGVQKDKTTDSPSIAVLPFANMSADPENEYFSDGLTEELINAFTKIEGLRVVARTSSFIFKGKDVDIREIGQKLNVRSVLEGSVRKAGNRIRITAQLINVQDGYHLWSEQYDRELEDVFAIQDEISNQIAETLKASLGRETVSIEHSKPDVKAYEIYLKGRYYWSKFGPESIQKAIECFNTAIEMDPGFALAHAALAETYVTISNPFGSIPTKEAMPKAKQAAEKALSIDPNLAEAYVSLGAVATFFEWDRKKAEEHFQRAISLNPNLPNARFWYELALSCLDQDFDEGKKQLKIAFKSDPLNMAVLLRFGYTHYYKYEFDTAIEYFEKMIELEPNSPIGHHGLSDAYGQKAEYDRALAEGEKAVEMGQYATTFVGVLGTYCGRAGKEERARELLDILLDRSKKTYVPPFWIAVIYLGMNDFDRTFEWLEKSFEQRDSNLLYLFAPPFDPIREDPRFIAFRKKMGFAT